MTNNTVKIASELSEKLIGIRRQFHMYPELGLKEVNTNKTITQILKSTGIEIMDYGLESGVIGVMDTGRPGPVIALRGDIDGLPMQEENDVPYKSQIPGRMHACGHDVHTTCTLGAAMILSQLKDSLSGRIKFLFEPAEELSGVGAKMLLDAGVMEDVDMIFGLHVNPDIPAGKFGIKSGPLMAAVDYIEITVTGIGGHGATPHQTIDPIVTSSLLVMAMQTAVSRNISPLDSAVVSIGTYHAGTAFNIISDSAKMTGTVRTFNPDVRSKLPGILKRIVENTAQAMGANGHLHFQFNHSAVINHKVSTEIAHNAAVMTCGEDSVIEPTPIMGGEDFGQLIEETEGCFLFLGISNPEKGIVHPLHSPKFDVDESCITSGTAVLAQCVINANQHLTNADRKG